MTFEAEQKLLVNKQIVLAVFVFHRDFLHKDYSKYNLCHVKYVENKRERGDGGKDSDKILENRQITTNK